MIYQHVGRTVVATATTAAASPSTPSGMPGAVAREDSAVNQPVPDQSPMSGGQAVNGRADAGLATDGFRLTLRTTWGRQRGPSGDDRPAGRYGFSLGIRHARRQKGARDNAVGMHVDSAAAATATIAAVVTCFLELIYDTQDESIQMGQVR